MTDVELVFEEPPPRKYGSPRTSQYESMKAVLTGRPGEWARVPGTFRSGYNTSIRRTLGPEFEVTSREMGKDDQGRRMTHIWVRYVGEAKS